MVVSALLVAVLSQIGVTEVSKRKCFTAPLPVWRNTVLVVVVDGPLVVALPHVDLAEASKRVGIIARAADLAEQDQSPLVVVDARG